MISTRFEHIGINVTDKEAAVTWYQENLGLTMIRDVPGVMSFLGDSKGNVMMEIYSNPDAPVIDFEPTHFLSLHIAFAVEDPAAAAEKLVQAGARIVDPIRQAGDDTLVMLKDPFGLAIQFIKRGTPMLRASSR